MMKTKNRHDQPVKLVASSAPGQRRMFDPVMTWLTHVGQAIANAVCSNHEPQVWEKKDRNGTLYWNVYDPATGYSARLASEMEVRIWLERHYTRSFD
jgi:hypothetical protein